MGSIAEAPEINPKPPPSGSRGGPLAPGEGNSLSPPPLPPPPSQPPSLPQVALSTPHLPPSRPVVLFSPISRVGSLFCSAGCISLLLVVCACSLRGAVRFPFQKTTFAKEQPLVLNLKPLFFQKKLYIRNKKQADRRYRSGRWGSVWSSDGAPFAHPVSCFLYLGFVSSGVQVSRLSG